MKVVVIGSSADGVIALQRIAQALPAGFAAPVLAVLHVGPTSQLAAILGRVAHVPVLHPADGQPLEPGQIYVVGSAEQMRVEPGRIRITADALHRHSIDALFCSAAEAYGPAVIGIVLTGYLDDGAEGQHAIKQAGGITIVQDPEEAAVPDMPLAAAARTTIDYRCRLADLGPLLCDLVR